jgi:hypothetical protein
MTELEHLCSGGDHAACIREAKSVLRTLEGNAADSPDVRSIMEIRGMLSEAAEKSGDGESAVTYWSDMLAQYGLRLTHAQAVRVRMNMAGILTRSGRYTDALAIYGEIEQRYGDIFPESYAKYAREAAGKIEAAQAARITGRALCRDGTGNGGITVKVFNGFESSYAQTDPSGDFAVPLYAATPGTRYCLFVYRQGYEPAISVHSFDGAATVELDDMLLAPAETATGNGMAMGIVYSAAQGGKIRNTHGISGLKQQALTFIRQHEDGTGETGGENEIIPLTSDENGIYRQWLPPGTYLLKTNGNEKEVLVKSEQFCINNITSGTHRID